MGNPEWFFIGVFVGGLVGLIWSIYMRYIIIENASHVVRVEPRLSITTKASMIARIRGEPEQGVFTELLLEKELEDYDD